MTSVTTLVSSHVPSATETETVFFSTQKARIENQDLQVQLGHALQQAADPNSKGNSLFAEVMPASPD